MIQRFENTILKLTIVVLLVFIAGSRQVASVEQNDESKTMRQIIEELNQRTIDEPGFIFTFRFQKPLFERDTDWWEIPYTEKDNPDLYINITEIGADYVCFLQTGGSSYVTLCTPFSNIATVNYGNFP